MDLNSTISSVDSRKRPSYKSMMNILKRAFSFRSRNNSNASLDTSLTCSIEVGSISADQEHQAQSPIGSEVASTSRDSVNYAMEPAPSVYEDPFVAVTADGHLYVKNYMIFNPRAEFRPEAIQYPHVRRLSRCVKISRISAIHFARYYECQNPEVCKPWGLCRNDVWWASHLNRQHSVNEYLSIVLEDETSSIKIGCTVVMFEAFIEALRALGLNQQSRMSHGIPSPPLSRVSMPFIDEEE